MAGAPPTGILISLSAKTAIHTMGSLFAGANLPGIVSLVNGRSKD